MGSAYTSRTLGLVKFSDSVVAGVDFDPSDSFPNYASGDGTTFKNGLIGDTTYLPLIDNAPKYQVPSGKNGYLCITVSNASATRYHTVLRISNSDASTVYCELYGLVVGVSSTAAGHHSMFIPVFPGIYLSVGLSVGTPHSNCTLESATFYPLLGA